MDIIQGPVTNVVDGDTFDMKVTHIGTENEIEYNATERVRFAGVDAPEMNTDAGKKAKEAPEKKLSGKTVNVAIDARDTYKRIVGTVKIVD